jgi:ATP-dependent Lon protease
MESLNESAKIKQVNAIFDVIRTGSAKKTGTTKENKIQHICKNLKTASRDQISQVYDLIYATESTSPIALNKTVQEIAKFQSNANEIKTNLDQITQTLDESIHGHRYAKDQILKIIAQWMNGEQSGYCFGFEGSPGIGKTSLAKKGLSQCLKNANGESRPFAFIAVGGSCNGSTLEGHSYTYVNSTWGKIVDILMDAKCMNPIIYVDELDKVSKTEHGKEIIGILTHLIDTTQNSVFQDKYFSGIDIDLSKVLFIFSYNDPSQIDSILIDRINRIRFYNLSLEEKIFVVKKYMIPEIEQKMGLENCITLKDEVIEYMIDTFTLESGVRKLKEIVFDLYGEINLQLLKCDTDTSLPIELSIDDLHTKYLSKYDKIIEKKIHTSPEMGIINGLWANALGRGGIIPIQAMFYPTATFLELKLTGMQGDVMKESMNVAKTLAWKLLSIEEQESLVTTFEKTKCQGLHIHCPEGAVSKDGPSAGAAITVAIYSLFSKRPINNTVAMTGEINLQGQVTEIGGLEHKIVGGIKAGIRKFLYPESNARDFDKFWKKMGDKSLVKDILFVPVSRIGDTFSHFF